ncbi:MAG TPA: hypothetical protein VMU33_17770 [Burkholderiaceae bacterium]|nr:hypothetical protein [Burkholderiaceae bacterium]
MVRAKSSMPAGRDMALALLASYRAALHLAPLPPKSAASAPQQPSVPASAMLNRMVQERSRQQRRAQDFRHRERQLRQAILRHEHRLAELQAELGKLVAEHREFVENA